MYNACHANHTHICWRKKKINKASFADFFSEKISKLAKKKCNFFLLLFFRGTPSHIFCELTESLLIFFKKNQQARVVWLFKV